jgi:hypothetical protein
MNDSTTSKSLSDQNQKAIGGRPESFGKGLDVGTSNLICAFDDANGDISLNHERNAFLDIDSDPFTRSMLNEQKVPYAVYNNSFYVLGQSAFEFANIVGKEVRRPMHGGMISPKEASALPVIKLLIERIVGSPRKKGEPLCFSIPADPVDSNMNFVYHRSVLSSLLERLGFRPFHILEGLSVIYSELADQDFTGIGISFGGGMANVCMAYRSVPAVAFSVARSGDWIDANAAEVLGMKSPRVTLVKERGVNILAPTSREEEAIAIFYRALIRYVGEQIHRYMTASNKLPEFPESVDLVCSGGTALAKGFIEVIREEFDRFGFPVKIREIRLAEEPLNATARGCLVAATSSE